MTAILAVLLISGAVVLAIPTAILCAECLLGLFPRRLNREGVGAGVDAGVDGKPPRIAVVVPAHDESSVIGPTVEHLRQQIGDGDVLLVVADNCGDDTARIAQEAGATVIVRVDPERRGKGYALSFATAHLKAREFPDAVVIIDADCRISEGGVGQLARLALQAQRPVQADYTLSPPPSASPGARMSAFAFRVRNRIRPRGLERLGGSVHLAGTGMAFPWTVFADAPSMEGHLTEDLALGVELTLGGYGPMVCADVHVTSDLAPHQAGQATQRQRWESGHLQTLARYVPKLLAKAFAQGRPKLLLSALDLAIPPLAMHVTLLLGGCVLGLLGWILGWSPLPAAAFMAEVLGTAATIGLVWFVAGRDVMRYQDWLSLPGYVLSKIPGYLRLLGRNRHLDWKKTDRNV
jgi:cellulose synthase/poly-beta-1,6-N-acetylglucosamine synthase-like glycosyltransferase